MEYHRKCEGIADNEEKREELELKGDASLFLTIRSREMDDEGTDYVGIGRERARDIESKREKKDRVREAGREK